MWLRGVRSKLKTSACVYCLSVSLRLWCDQDEDECLHVQDLCLLARGFSKDLHNACWVQR